MMSTFDVQRDPPLAHARAIANGISRSKQARWHAPAWAMGGKVCRSMSLGISMSHPSCRPSDGAEADMKDENLFRFQTLDIYRAARELAQRVHCARIRDRELRD